MKFIKYIGLAVIALGVASCGSTAKTGEQSPVQSPLKLSSAGEVLSQTCASYGCDEVLRKRCDGGDFRILNQGTRNKYNNKKNHVTGTWSTTRKESVKILFKCVPQGASKPTELGE